MRILNEDNDKSIDHVLLCLTREEVLELMSSLKEVLEKPESYHSHIPSNDNKKELTICMYDEGSLNSGFSDRVKELIKVM